jgi:hypothetical protein
MRALKEKGFEYLTIKKLSDGVSPPNDYDLRYSSPLCFGHDNPLGRLACPKLQRGEGFKVLRF